MLSSRLWAHVLNLSIWPHDSQCVHLCCRPQSEVNTGGHRHGIGRSTTHDPATLGGVADVDFDEGTDSIAVLTGLFEANGEPIGLSAPSSVDQKWSFQLPLEQIESAISIEVHHSNTPCIPRVIPFPDRGLL